MQQSSISTRTETRTADGNLPPRASSLRPLAVRVPSTPSRAVRTGDAHGDAELVARLVLRDPAAWRQFTQKYAPLVISCIRRVLGRFSRITSEHDVDEVYARFCAELLASDHKKLRAYDPARGSRLSTWLGLLAGNTTYDYLRRIKRDRVCEPLSEADGFVATGPSPYDVVALRERAALASEILSELSLRDREFVELYFGEGLDVEAIAERMQISIKTVYTKKHKITARLERLLVRLRAA
jgi:RNA polymerase sigma-70 factor (ECF subfamily)